MLEVVNPHSKTYSTSCSIWSEDNGCITIDSISLSGRAPVKCMEIVKDDVKGELYKNGDKYKRYNGGPLDAGGNVLTSNNQNSSNKNDFSFHADGYNALNSKVLISPNSNSESIKSRQSTESPSNFKYHANEDVEYRVNIIRDCDKVPRNKMSPDYQDRLDNHRKHNTSNLDDNSSASKTISLSSLNQIRSPSPPRTRPKFSLGHRENRSLHDSKTKIPEHEETSIRSKNRTLSPEMTKKQSEFSNNDVKNKANLRKTSPQRIALPERKGILKNTVSPRKSIETDSNKTESGDLQKENGNFSPVNQTISGNTVDNLQTDNTDANTNTTEENSGRSEEKPPQKQTTTTKLPPTGKRSSLVGNGDINLPQANHRNSLVGKPNGDINHHNRGGSYKNKANGDNNQHNIRNGSYKRPAEKHVSSIQKQDATSSQNNKSHTKDKSDTDRMSIGSRSSNNVQHNRNISPKTDASEKSMPSRSTKRENGPLMSPRTEKSTDSHTTSSESRMRSKEFTFRWNAPSRNTSPEATEKSTSPPVKQFKPSAQIQSFYSYLYGRSKKRKSIANPPTRPKGILAKSSYEECKRPHSFVLLRSKTNKLSAWDNNPVELTYKPSTNGPGEISQAYVGEDSIREAEMTKKLQQMQGKSKSPDSNVMQKRSKVPPCYENGYVLNRRQAGVYRNISYAYGREMKQQRERKFVQKLAEYEVVKAKQQWEDLLEKERRKRATKERQMLQLNELRQRFEDEAYHRFHTQYVTSRVLEHEKMNRSEYGLPEEADDEPENPTIIKRKKVMPKSLITEDMIQDIYKKKFNKIFDVNTGNGLGKRPKTPKMEGIDTIVIEEKDNKDVDKRTFDGGKTKERKRMVKDVIQAAEKQVKENQKERKQLSTPLGEKENKDLSYMKDIDLDGDSDDDDMDDIFEKARRKYDLDVDD